MQLNRIEWNVIKRNQLQFKGMEPTRMKHNEIKGNKME